jgi:hypothetical protein
MASSARPAETAATQAAVLLLSLALAAAPTGAAKKPPKALRILQNETGIAEQYRNGSADTLEGWLRPILEAALATTGGSLGYKCRSGLAR